MSILSAIKEAFRKKESENLRLVREQAMKRDLDNKARVEKKEKRIREAAQHPAYFHS